MKQKPLFISILMIVSLMFATNSALAQTKSDTQSRVEKLEERVLNLEARMAKVEEASHKRMGMMPNHPGMKMQGQQQDMGSGMNTPPMGQQPQQVPPQNPNMNNGMPQGGGMGDM